MAQRRLPNGRFAKVIQLPAGKARGLPKSSSGLGGAVIISTNAKQIADKLKVLPERTIKGLQSDAEKQAERVQARLRSETAVAYHRAATGRFSRGLYARVIKTDTGAAIRISMINYRESRFLTNLGGLGEFSNRPYPIPPYRIYAKNARDVAIKINDKGEVELRKGRQAMKQLRFIKGVGRLKVPRSNVIFEASRTRGGGESRRPVEVLTTGGVDPFDFSVEPKSGAFFYPLWVEHPGFERDVVSEVTASERERIISEMRERVQFEHESIGQSVLRGENIETDVSAIIPLPSLTVQLTRKTIGFGSVEAAGLERLNRAIE